MIGLTPAASAAFTCGREVRLDLGVRICLVVVSQN